MPGAGCLPLPQVITTRLKLACLMVNSQPIGLMTSFSEMRRVHESVAASATGSGVAGRSMDLHLSLIFAATCETTMVEQPSPWTTTRSPECKSS